MPDRLVVLMAEDEDDHAELVMESLAASRVEICATRAIDGQHALDHLRTCLDDAQPLPDVVLLDLRMPRMDGFEALRLIRNEGALAHIAVVVMSTSEAQADHAKALDLDADGYLVKPTTFSALIARTYDLGEVLRNFARRR